MEWFPWNQMRTCFDGNPFSAILKMAPGVERGLRRESVLCDFML